MSKLINLIGQKFERLTVVERATNTSAGKTRWLCKCECGNHKTVLGEHLKNGHTKSCGCFKKEKFKPKIKHGLTHTRLYNIWASMKSRCYNKNNQKNYKDYGERGITVCDDWKNNFNAFKKWAYENGYSENLTIDRIDVNGNYEPNNCKWSTVKEQANNKRTNHFVAYQGEMHTLAEWCRKLELDYNVIIKRIDYHKWNIERAFTQPIRGRS